MPIVVILVALKSEALPIIESFRLRRYTKSRRVFYSRGLLNLVITGVGKKRVENSINWIEGYFDSCFYVNLGVCGSVCKKVNIGTLIYINKLFDEEVDWVYYPDNLIKHALRTYSLTSCVEEYSGECQVKGDMVDMEAAFALRSMKREIGPHKYQVIKVVSDYCDGRNMTSGHISFLISDVMDDIKLFISGYLEVIKTLSELGKEDLLKLSVFMKEHRFTKSQRSKLTRLVRLYYYNYNKLPNRICGSSSAFELTVIERNQIFESLCNDFLCE